MIKSNNILIRYILLLILIVGWGGSTWAQNVTQLPLTSGVYEILNISNESGAGTGRGYLVSFTQHSSGIGLADCTYSGYRNRHPLEPNDGSTTCSYWYLHNHGDGTYTLVSISTLGGNSVPRFLTVGPNGGKSSIATTPETRLVFTDTNTGNHNRNGKKAVNIANQSATNVYLSGGCGTYSTSGSIMATTTSGDGGCPWLFMPVEETSLSEGQKAIRDKYLERFATLPDGTKLVYQDTEGHPITSTSNLVKYTPIGGGYTVEFSSSNVTYNFHSVQYNPGEFCGTFEYSLQQVNFNKATSTLTFTLAINKWYKMKVANVSAYVSTDYADANGMRLTSGQDDPDIYAGLWRSVDVGGASLNSDGKNVSLYNAKYYETRILAMTSPASDGNSRGAMYAIGSVPAGAATVFEQRTKSDQANSYYFRITGTGVNTNTYINQRNPYFSNWTNGGYGGTGSQFIYEEVPNLGTAVTIKVKDAKGVEIPAGKIVYTSQRVDIPIVKDQLGNDQVYNFGNVPFVRTLFSDSPTSHILNIEYDEEHALLTFTIEKMASVDWMVVIKGNNDYTVDYRSLVQAKNNEILTLSPTIKEIDLKINAPADKFVWGPVIDSKTKTISFEVSDRVETWNELADGWYQLMLTASTNAQNTANNLIKHEEGNINISSNYLYLATGVYGISDGAFKLTGVPDYAGREATYVHIAHSSNQVTFTNLHGQSFTTTCALNNGLLALGGWNVTSTAHPYEGPFVTTTSGSNYYLNFSAVPVVMNDYDQYRVVLQGPGASADVRLECTHAALRGISTLKDGDLLLIAEGSNTPGHFDFKVTKGNAYVSGANVGEKGADGVTPLYITLSTNVAIWKVYFTGDATASTDSLLYNGFKYANGYNVTVPVGIVPSPVDLRTNVTDRFVWGPIIDEAHKTITFDVRTPATNLEAGAWYQLQLSPTAEGRYYVPNETGNLVTGVLKMNPRNAGSQIYMIGANKTSGSWTVEFIGKPANEAETYLYINYRNGNATQVMMQNGYYITDQSQHSASAANTQFQYNSATHDFHWRNPVYPWGGLNGMPAGVGKSSNADGPIKVIAHKASVKAYKVMLSTNSGTLVYNGDVETVGSNRAEHGRFIFVKEGLSLETEIAKYELRGLDGSSISSISATTNNGITTLNVQVTTPAYPRQIVHRQAYYYDQIETDAKAPGAGFIRSGEGMTTRQGTNGPITEQTMAVFEIPVYVKRGTTFTSYMPTDQVTRYQRWYNWDTDQQVDGRVLTSLSGWNVSQANTYTNGHLTGGSYGGFKGSPVFQLPDGVDSYNVGLDLAHYPTRGTIGNNGALVEPTLAMRIVYKVRDAKQIAKAIKDSTDAGRFYEVHNIAYPNVHHGSLEDRTLSSLMPLDMDLNNYWMFDGDGETDRDLLQLGSDGMLRVEVVQESAGALLRNVMMIPGSTSNASGNISRKEFKTGHFVLFQYPESGVVPAGSTATINVYLRKNASSKEYKMAQFNLTFIGNSEPVVVTELKNTFRHPDVLRSNFGEPVAELTFDNTTNNEFGTWYRYPLDYKGVSYAFGTQVSGGGHTGYFASRGEYGLGTQSGTSGSTDGATYQYYPVSNYLRNMKDDNAALSGTKLSNSYQLYIDAADQPGKIASIALEDALCAGSRLYCYGYIGCTSGRANQHPTSVLINVMGTNKNTGEEELIYSYCPGVISLRGYAADGRIIYSTALGSSSVFTPHSSTDGNYWAAWQQIGFSFAIGAEVAARMSGYSIQIVNNAYNSDGGDTMLDDFQIFVKKPGAEVANTTPLCSDQIRHIKVITEYNTLLEATGEDSNHDGLMNVGFCFLDKDVYDQALIDFADNINLPRTDAENTYNKAFGLALMGRRTLDRAEKDHAFHNFDIPRDGVTPTYVGAPDTTYYYDNIEKYSFKESMDDKVYRDSIRGERYIVFKESVAHGEASGLTQHKWEAGKSYYLLFSTATISEQHVNNHDLGCTVFNLDDNQCSVLFEFMVAPPVTIKGDASEIVSGDEVNACEGQVTTLSVNLNGRTETEDVVIKNLDYDWWVGVVSDTLTVDGVLTHQAYNTTSATLDNYLGAWYGLYTKDNVHLDKHIGDTVFLSDAMLEFRRAYPTASSMQGVEPKHVTGDTEEYEFTDDLINCINHFLEPDESGNAPLILYRKQMNLSLSIDKADENRIVHFVVMPIAPGIYSVDEDAIYCPDPQELKIRLTEKAPVMQNGFSNVTYPEQMTAVPIRAGLSQLTQVRHLPNTNSVNYLRIPLRGIELAYADRAQALASDTKASLFLVGTDDPNYEVSDEVVQEAGEIHNLLVSKNAVSGFDNTHVDVSFLPSFRMREGYTYTFKIYFVEVIDVNLLRDEACMGSFVFDLIVVPEYQLWTGAAGNNDWNNDLNWRRADVAELHADNASDGQLAGYMSNAENTTTTGRVPMSFTNVLMDSIATVRPILYSYTRKSDGIAELQNAAKAFIEYDMLMRADSVADAPTGNYSCELYNANICNGITFLPGGELYNAHLLTYRRAWVEYLLATKRWHLLASPLQGTYAGEWYAPTATGKEDAPHFYQLTYDVNRNNRFAPAIYQRSWDHSVANIYRIQGDGLVASTNPLNVGVRLDWSHVYNDVQVPYSLGGFSVKPVPLDMPKDVDSVLIRMPKDDNEYLYFQRRNPQNGDRPQAIAHGAEHHRLITDRLTEQESFTDVLTTTVGNPYVLVANPFMTPMNLDAFLTANSSILENTVWTMEHSTQHAHLRNDDGWVSTSVLPSVAPLQAFFVRLKDSAIPADGKVNITYSRSMQQMPSDPAPVVRRSLLTLSHDGGSISLYDGEQSANSLLDSNTAEYESTIFFLSEGEAHAVQAIADTVTRIPLGVQASFDTILTTLRLGVLNDTDDWYVLDALEDEEEPLTEDWSLTVHGSTFGRYFLVRRSADSQITEDLENNELSELGNRIYVTVYGDRIAVVSSHDDLTSVSLITPAGQMLESQTLPMSTREAYLYANPGVTIVQVVTRALDGTSQCSSYKIKL